METIVDPTGAASHNAPIDDQPETEDEKLAVVEAHSWVTKNGGKGIPHAEAMRRLALD